MSEPTKGRFIWYELMSTDPEAAKTFYSDVVGWGVEEMEVAGEAYSAWNGERGHVGGVMQLPAPAAAAGAPSHWLAYLATPNAAETAERAAELGATILFGPMEIPSIGSFAVIADPQGAAFAVFTPEGGGPGHEPPPATGEFSWHELYSTDAAAAWDFYSDLFGWRETSSMDMGENGMYRMFGADESTAGGMCNKPPQIPASSWLLYVQVSDLDRAVERVAALGGQVLNGPMEVPGGDRVAQCIDPQGAAFALHTPGDLA